KGVGELCERKNIGELHEMVVTRWCIRA
ncbi:MAG: hypothetical protein QG668_18, partial [Patescibacteria group bacterium]|nr:hypothetical protein [Patescibacteria group bacterium]